MSTLLEQLKEKFKARQEDTPEEAQKAIIEIIRAFSMDNCNDQVSLSFLVAENGKFMPLPIPSSVLHSPLGDMLVKKHFELVCNEEYTPHSIVDINFGRGIVAKVEKKNTERVKELEELKDKWVDAKKNGEEFTHEDFQEYMLVHIFDKKEVNVLIYDVITSHDKDEDKDYILISEKPITEHSMSYKEANHDNYFEKE